MIKFMKVLVRVDDPSIVYEGCDDTYDQCEAVREQLAAEGLEILDCIPAQRHELDVLGNNPEEPYLKQTVTVVPMHLLFAVAAALRMNPDAKPLYCEFETNRDIHEALKLLPAVGQDKSVLNV